MTVADDQRDQDDPNSGKVRYVVAAPYVTLKHLDRYGSQVITGFYQGSPVPPSADEDTVQRLLDKQMLLRVDDPIAGIVAVPAGTPMPGEPPNVPVAEVPDTSLGARLERARDAVKGGRSKSADEAKDGSAKAPAQNEPEPPAVTDTKPAWVDYAVARGEDRKAAEGMSKEQLVGKYGKRA